MPLTKHPLLSTRFETEYYEHPDSIGGVYIIDTPIGKYNVETHETFPGLLTSPQRVQKDIKQIQKELRDVEDKAITYLILEWQKKNPVKE